MNKKLTHPIKSLFTLVLVACSLTLAQSAKAQASTVTVHLSGVTMKHAMDEIEKQSDYLFLSGQGVDINTVVTVNADSQSIDSVLGQILGGTNYTYKIEGKHILLQLKEAAVVPAVARPVTGSIHDSAGVPIAGATVMVAGTNNGVISDATGAFRISAATGQTLVVNFISYETYEVAVTDANNYDIELLESDATTIENVVITALGIKRSEKSVSYNVQGLNSEELSTVKSDNFLSSLAGKIAGLEVKSVSGGVGSATRITLRGSRSITQQNTVLYVIDGIPVYNFGGSNIQDEFSSEAGSESMAEINSDDIANITVLSGASAAALYGSQAANGAVMITTKQGVAGRTKITYTNQTTLTSPFVMPEFQNKYGNNIGVFDSWGAELPQKSAYNPRDFFQTGASTQNVLSFSGGTERSQTYISIGAANARGIVPNNTYDRYTITLRNTSKHFNDKLTVDISANYMQQDDRNLVSQGEYFNPLTAVYLFPRGENFDYIRSFEHFNEGRNIYTQNWGYGDQGIAMQNPYWVTQRNIFEHKRKRFAIAPTITYKITKWLSAQVRGRLDNTYSFHTRELSATTIGLLAGGDDTESSKGNFRLSSIHDESFYLDGMLIANYGCGDFSINGVLGASIHDVATKNMGVGGTLRSIPNLFIKENLYQPGTFGEDQRRQTQSIYGSAEIGWRGAVYLTLTGRNDWASQLAGFPVQNFFYPSVGMSVVISSLANLPEKISYFKVRGSWAKVGSPIPFGLSNSAYKMDPYSQQLFVSTTTYKMPQLYPEWTRSWEGGFDLRMFSNKFFLETTYYHTNTTNQTLNVPLTGSTGYTDIWVQTGDVLNRGFEFRVGYDLNVGKDFLWEPSIVGNWNDNEIIDLGGMYHPFTGAWEEFDTFQQASYGSVAVRLKKGGTLGDLYSTRELERDVNGNIWVSQLGQIATVDDTSNNNLGTKVGTTMAKWRFGFRNNFEYKGVHLGVLFSARVGGQVLSRTQAMMDYYGVSKTSANMRDEGGKWVNAGLIDAQTWYKTVGGKQGVYKYYIYDATNVRLSELSLGYRLPSKWFNDKVGVNVSVLASNLWMIYNKAPFDPEATASTANYYQGVDYFMQPSTRSIGFSLKLDF